VKRGAEKHSNDLLEPRKGHKRLGGGGYEFEVRALIATVMHPGFGDIVCCQGKPNDYFFYQNSKDLDSRDHGDIILMCSFAIK
jgi:hypothetical protein